MSSPAPYNGYSDEVVLNEDGTPSGLTMPVQQVEYLHREPGRGMMPFEGREDPVYARYLKSLPLDELKFALAKSDNAKAISFLADLADPGKADTDITTLAKLNKIGLPEMMQVWRSHKLVGAMGVFVEHSPTIAEHTVEDAKSREICCPRCDGAGMIRVCRRDEYEWIDCITCRGSGAVRKPGEHKSRQQIFEAVGIITQKPSTVVNQIVNNSVESVIDELETVTIEAKPEGLMWIRVIRLFTKSLSRIASALEEIRDLYKLDCEARGIIQVKPGMVDQTEIAYGYIDDERH